MDLPNSDVELLQNTYRQFYRINKMLSGWDRIYHEYLQPRMNTSRRFRLLDIGFGGGDIPVILSKLARRDGFHLEITAIEADERAYRFTKTLPFDDRIEFRHCYAHHMVSYGERFDFVISNHLLHHLRNNEMAEILEQAKTLSRDLILFSDIERSDVGYALFGLTAPFMFHNSFIVEDGLISIRKSFTKRELEKLVPEDWTVTRQFPFRLLLTHEKE